MRIILFAVLPLILAACGTRPESDTATEVTMGESIELLTPPLKGGLTINEALWMRRSWREYSPEALSLEELSGVVWAAAGINRPENGHLTAPSALALYPLRTYAFLKEGVYLYDAATHRLILVQKGDHRAVTGAQPFVDTAPLNLVFVADINAYADRRMPIEQVRYFCGLDAAGCAENVNLYTAGHGLRSVTRGSASRELLPEIGLDTLRYMFALAVSVGK